MKIFCLKLLHTAIALGLLALGANAQAAIDIAGPAFVSGVGPELPGQRIYRDGTPSVCATAKSFPGLSGTSGYQYAETTVFNNGPERCITVNITAENCGASNPLGIHLTAYLGSFDPGDLSANYLGDTGNSAIDNTQTLEFVAPANSSIVLVTNENIEGSDVPPCTYRITSAELGASHVAASATPVPATGPLALLLMGGLLTAAGAVRMRRKG